MLGSGATPAARRGATLAPVQGSTMSSVHNPVAFVEMTLPFTLASLRAGRDAAAALGLGPVGQIRLDPLLLLRHPEVLAGPGRDDGIRLAGPGERDTLRLVGTLDGVPVLTAATMLPNGEQSVCFDVVREGEADPVGGAILRCTEPTSQPSQPKPAGPSFLEMIATLHASVVVTDATFNEAGALVGYTLDNQIRPVFSLSEFTRMEVSPNAERHPRSVGSLRAAMERVGRELLSGYNPWEERGIARGLWKSAVREHDIRAAERDEARRELDIARNAARDELGAICAALRTPGMPCPTDALEAAREVRAQSDKRGEVLDAVIAVLREKRPDILVSRLDVAKWVRAMLVGESAPEEYAAELDRVLGTLAARGVFLQDMRPRMDMGGPPMPAASTPRYGRLDASFAVQAALVLLGGQLDEAREQVRTLKADITAALAKAAR